MNMLAERLEYYRNVQGCKTRKEFAQKCGVGISTLADIYSGKSSTLSVRNAKKICDFCGCSLEDLIGNPPVEQQQDELFKKRKLLFDLSAKATEEDVDRFILMLNAVIGNE